jgi:two-component system nitrate/nitrite response regulator NarL
VISVFILAGVRLYREGLEQWLTSTGAVSVVGMAAAPAEAMESMAALRPDVVLLDMGLPASLRVARDVRTAIPTTKVIALAVTGVGADVIACAEAGIRGYLTRDGTLSDLLETIEYTVRGETLCPPRVTADLFERLAAVACAGEPKPAVDASLTQREAQIAALIERGQSNKEIARTLSIALPTVKNHVHNVLRKLHVERRTEIAGYVRGFVVAGGRR